METYDVYEIYYRGKVADYKDMISDGNEGYCRGSFADYVYKNGDCDLVATYDSLKEAYRMWEGRWAKYAETKLDEYDYHIFTVVMYKLEKTIRDENEEPIESYNIAESIAFLGENEVKNGEN